MIRPAEIEIPLSHHLFTVTLASIAVRTVTMRNLHVEQVCRVILLIPHYVLSLFREAENKLTFPLSISFSF